MRDLGCMLVLNIWICSFGVLCMQTVCTSVIFLPLCDATVSSCKFAFDALHFSGSFYFFTCKSFRLKNIPKTSPICVFCKTKYPIYSWMPSIGSQISHLEDGRVFRWSVVVPDIIMKHIFE